MAKRISNMNQLEKALQPVMVKMVDELAERVYQTLNYFLQEYYTGWEPSSYRRTEAFLRSAVKIDAKPYKNGAKASVYVKVWCAYFFTVFIDILLLNTYNCIYLNSRGINQR